MIDITQVIANILPTLGFQNLADLGSSDWLQAAELYQWADEAQQRLAHDASVFTDWDATTQSLGAQASYAFPSNFVAAVAVYYDGAKLRPTTVRELLALDATWKASGGTPQRVSVDAGNLGTYTVYPVPTSGGATILLVFQKYLPPISVAASTVSVSSPVQDFFAYHMLAEARRKESEAAMPDMADHFAQRVGLFHEIFRKYYGGGQ